MLSQYGDQFCEIVLKSDLKDQSYRPNMILLQGHAVTLTFKVATQIVRILYTLLPMHVQSFMRLALIVFKLSKDPDF